MAVLQVFKRYEKKYILTREQERAFLKKIEDKMQLDKYGRHTICNIYFDTPDFDLVRTSIEKPLYKEKLRLRSYGVPQDENSTVFVELKKKYCGVVYKRRVPLTLGEAEDYLYRGHRPEKQDQILDELDWFLKMNKVEPGVYLAYDRRAFFGLDNPDFRLTLDTNIRARRSGLQLSEGSRGEYVLDEDLVLMEIKIPGAMPIWMSRILSELSIFPVSFSKYGTYYKHNRDIAYAVLQNHLIEDEPDLEAWSGDAERNRIVDTGIACTN